MFTFVCLHHLPRVAAVIDGSKGGSQITRVHINLFGAEVSVDGWVDKTMGLSAAMRFHFSN